MIHFVRFMRRFLRIPAGFILVLALASGPLALAQTTGNGGTVTLGVIMQTRGNVALKSLRGPSLVLKKGQVLRSGALVQSGPDSNTVFAFPDGQVGALGPKGVFRLNDYVYDPRNLGKSEFSFSLIEGGLRVVMGEIGQGNPSALKLQIGTATVSLQSSQESKPADASLVTLEGAVAISVEDGRLDVKLPSGQTQQVNAGQTLFISQTGELSLGTKDKMLDVIGNSALGREIVAQLLAAQSYGPAIQQAQSAMANVTAALKAGKDPSVALTLVTGDPAAALALLKQLENLPAPGATTPTIPSGPAAGTPSTGGGGGGTPCAASCN